MKALNEKIVILVTTGNAHVKGIMEVGQLVRCKDCKHRPLNKDDPNFWEWYGEDTRCPWFCADTYYLAVPPDDFFCAYGERHQT